MLVFLYSLHFVKYVILYLYFRTPSLSLYSYSSPVKTPGIIATIVIVVKPFLANPNKVARPSLRSVEIYEFTR